MSHKLGDKSDIDGNSETSHLELEIDTNIHEPTGQAMELGGGGGDAKTRTGQDAHGKIGAETDTYKEHDSCSVEKSFF